MGRDAELIDTPDPAALRAEIVRRALPGVEDVVPGARTVLVRMSPGYAPDLRWAADWRPDEASLQAGRELTIPVHYDGPDLDDVAARAGVGTDDVVALHTGAVYTVAFTGFAPGFGYLTGLPDPLRVPRRSEPRTRVPAGAVGLAGEFTGVYPRPSPGGWQLIGHTEQTLWDATADPPAFLSPGDRVRFVPC
ncbi:5-oxoprolinase subunit PxpB [Cryptosporangium aurantiacum]|uniref:Sensor histidine kinase inhibitor, KipI family n=1 Tax=Cryptosporangium aurantiacum TaxID=134849 RepID=A0A1M7RH09_9ACTN|nr:5-oxoprolinase subunit PxpB [Cryptosporangium aurantiacum]SHN45439.1 sensor histidine kinase inhibitor, KipI family [Cryptosporangium aurantiacum]